MIVSSQLDWQTQRKTAVRQIIFRPFPDDDCGYKEDQRETGHLVESYASPEELKFENGSDDRHERDEDRDTTRISEFQSHCPEEEL